MVLWISNFRRTYGLLPFNPHGGGDWRKERGEENRSRESGKRGLDLGLGNRVGEDIPRWALHKSADARLIYKSSFVYDILNNLLEK